jgi:hypothetical protein
MAAAALAVVTTAGAGRASTDGAASGAEGAQAGDTTLVMETGDRIDLVVRPRTATGIELCAGVGPRIRPGKTLFARNDGQGAGLPTTLRFATSSFTPYCTTHRAARGDSLTVAFSKQVRDEVGRVFRLTVGTHRLAAADLERRRVTFRWAAEGADSVAAGALPDGATP